MKLEVWFEFASTYSYLTVARVEALARDREVAFEWRPFLLGPIFRDRGMETSPFVLDPERGAYMWRDMERRCESHGLPFVRPPVFPMNGLKAARIMTAALTEPWHGDFARAVFTAQFAHGADIADDAVLTDALRSCRVSPGPWIDRAQQDDTKRKLREATDHARRRGIFGAPSFLVGDELFWGDDRLEDAIDFCRTGADEDLRSCHASVPIATGDER